MAQAQTITGGERGQTTSEYVAITAAAVAIALGVGFGVLGVGLSSAVDSIANRLTSFIDTVLP